MSTANNLRIDINNECIPAINIPKSTPQRITEKYLKGAKLEYFNQEIPMSFDENFQNQYVAALHNAFAEHYAFVINPDDIWLLILQGLSIHINQNSDKFRDVLVDFDGKKEIIVDHDSLIKGNNDNTWSLVFPMFQQKISELIKDNKLCDYIVPTFSTTTDIDKTCFRISLMDITKSYFSYVVRTRCGIPTIFIDGVKEDWVHILYLLSILLPKFEMTDWAKELSDIINKIIDAFNGKTDKDFFNNIYKYESHSGSDTVTGWINNFFPYIVENKNREGIIVPKVTKEINRFRPVGSLQTSNFPSSICSVPFVWDYFGEKYNMDFYAGFCGFDESQNNAIRPRKNFFIAYKKDGVLRTETKIDTKMHDEIRNRIRVTQGKLK